MDHTFVVRCFVSRFLFVTVVAVVRGASRGWVVEARIWGLHGVVAVGVVDQSEAIRAARAAARTSEVLGSAKEGIAELLTYGRPTEGSTDESATDCTHLNGPDGGISEGSATDTRQNRSDEPLFVEGAHMSSRARVGKANGRATLSPQQVQQIRDAVRIGFSQHAVAAHFGLSQSTVSDIIAGRLWAHLPDAPAAALRPVRLELVETTARTHGGVLAEPGRVTRVRPDDAANNLDDDDNNEVQA